MTLARQQFGQKAEEMAQRHLVSLGYVLLACRWRGPSAEIDIVARQGDTLCFVEVRAKSSARFGHPLQTINHAKQMRIRAGARAWLRANRGPWIKIRFDTVGIISGYAQQRPEIVLVQGAFVDDHI